MKNIRFASWTVPLALLLLCIFSYGLLIPWLGFYWDDWPAIWFLHFLGPSGFTDVFASDRPLLGRLFWITTAILGELPIQWQFFGLISRWLSSVAIWWTLKSLWPSHTEESGWIALLIAIYPGFGQQFISVTYSHGFVVMTTFWVSLGTMIWALRKPRWFWPLTVLSLLLAAYSLFTVEYFSGLELLRPILIWVVIKEKPKKTRIRLRDTILNWLPYLALFVTFFVWRTFIQETPRGDVDIFHKLLSSPIATVQDIAQEIFSDILVTSVSAWVQTVNFSKLIDTGTLPTLLYVVLVLIMGVIAYIYLSRLAYPAKVHTRQNYQDNLWAYQAIGLGIYSLFIGGWPFWATNLPIELYFPWDRFTLPMMFGASLLLVGVISLLARNRAQKIILVSLLIGLGASWQFRNANTFRREWNTQQAFFWQLAWRAPAIEPNTLILASELPFTYYSDNSLTALLNWTYDPENFSVPMPYLLYAIESRLGKGLPDLDPGVDIYEEYRATHFSGSTSQALVLYYIPPGCVKVLDPNNDARLPQKPKYISDAMKLSRPSLILNPRDPAKPPWQYFAPEPVKDWCYYFEKADLARQNADWEQVVALSEKTFALDQGLYAINAPEYLPYIEGHAHLGNWEQAVSLTEQSLKLNNRMSRILCDTWSRIAEATPDSPQKAAAITSVQVLLDCRIP